MKIRPFARVVPVVSAILVAGMVVAACGSTTSSLKSTTTTAPLTHQPAKAIWPFVSDGVRYVTPTAVARSFVQNYVGMTSPLIGAFTRADSRSGQVAIRTRAGGPVTTVHVSRLTNDVSWWVTSASSPEILVSSPNSLQVVHSPLATSGSSTAFEAVVNVVLRMDGSMSAIADDTVMGGSIAGMGPFNGSIRFSGTSSGAGAVTYITRSAQDGSIIEATVVRVRY